MTFSDHDVKAHIEATLSLHPLEHMTASVSVLIATFLDGLFRELHSKRVGAKINVGVTELLTNVIQHVSRRDGGMRISLKLKSDHLVLKVQNRATPEEYQKLKAIIDEVSTAESPGALFVKTLRERRSHHEEGGLGLIRLASESKFQLNLQYVNDVLTVVAVLPVGDE